MKKKGSRKKGMSVAEAGRRGGISRAKKLNPEQRQRIASYGGRAAASNRNQRKGNEKKNGK